MKRVLFCLLITICYANIYGQGLNVSLFGGVSGNGYYLPNNYTSTSYTHNKKTSQAQPMAGAKVALTLKKFSIGLSVATVSIYNENNLMQVINSDTSFFNNTDKPNQQRILATPFINYNLISKKASLYTGINAGVLISPKGKATSLTYGVQVGAGLQFNKALSAFTQLQVNTIKPYETSKTAYFYGFIVGMSLIVL